MITLARVLALGLMLTTPAWADKLPLPVSGPIPPEYKPREEMPDQYKRQEMAFWMKGGRLYASGQITPQSFAAFLEILRTYERPRVIRLWSRGGSLVYGTEMGLTLARTEIATEVVDMPMRMGGPDMPATCSSACVTVFMGGRTRYASPSARFGIHRATYAPGAVRASYETEQEWMADLIRLYAIQNVSFELLEAQLRVPTDTMRWLTSLERNRYNLQNTSLPILIDPMAPSEPSAQSPPELRLTPRSLWGR